MSDSNVDHSQHVYHEGFPLREGDRLSLLHRITRTRLIIVLFLVVLVIFSIISSIYLELFVFIIGWLGVIGHIKLRRFADWAMSTWICTICFVFKYFFGVNVRVFGHEKPFKDKCLLILNHRCHFDWLFFWLVQVKLGKLDRWTVMMKNDGKNIPVIGWAMQWLNYIFMSRRWEKDEKELAWKLNYIKETNAPYHLLMFPEGTDLTPSHKKKSDDYADQNDLPHYNYCLHPKSTGFLYTVKTLRKYKISAIYDITVGYPDIFAKTEPDIVLEGRLPREIHYHITRHDLSEMPESDEELEKWLRKRWEIKEERLRLFYAHREFMEVDEDISPEVTHQVRNQGVKTEATINGASILSRSPEVVCGMPWWELFKGLLFLFVLDGSSIILFVYSWWGVAFGAISILLHLYVSAFTNGMDYIIMNHFRKNYKDFLPNFKTGGGGGTTVR